MMILGALVSGPFWIALGFWLARNRAKLLDRARAILRGQSLTFCGWFRSEARFRRLFPAYNVQRVDLGGMTGFLLTR